METFNVILDRVRTLSESTKDFRFVRVDGKALVFTAGQFYRFIFEDENGTFERSYSLCNYASDAAGSDLDLVISRVEGGRASRLLFAAEAGLAANVSGPFGRLVLPKEMPKRLFLVATSVGIAPYMPMLKELTRLLRLAENDALEIHMLYGVRDHSEFIYGADLCNYAARQPRFNLHLCLSRVAPSLGALKVDSTRLFLHKGYVQSALAALKPDPATDFVLLCGNPKMIDETYADLKSLGFGVRNVVREKYVFAKDKVKSAAGPKALSAEQKQLIADKMKRHLK